MTVSMDDLLHLLLHMNINDLLDMEVVVALMLNDLGHVHHLLLNNT